MDWKFMYYLHKIIFHPFKILLTSRALRFIVKDIRHKVLNFIWVDQTSAMTQQSKIQIKYNLRKAHGFRFVIICPIKLVNGFTKKLLMQSKWL